MITDLFYKHKQNFDHTIRKSNKLCKEKFSDGRFLCLEKSSDSAMKDENRKKIQFIFRPWKLNARVMNGPDRLDEHTIYCVTVSRQAVPTDIERRNVIQEYFNRLCWRIK